MPKVFTSKHQKVGEIGEHVAARYLIQKGYKIVERNYTKKWGEIDIVAKKGSKLYFIEVKSQSVMAIAEIDHLGLRPEENMHSAKIERLRRTIQTYLLEKRYEGDWQFDLIVIFIDQNSLQAIIRIIDNVIL